MSGQSSCPKCSKPMEEGYVLDHGDHNARFISRWVAGKPERSLWVRLKLGGRDVLEVRTFRCSDCGYLESYAIKP